MIFLRLFYEFFKVGLFSFGGGLATIPFLYELSTSTGWFTAAQLADMIAVSESTPGPLGVNMASYTGYATAGLLGSVTAVMGLIAPSIIIILILVRLLVKFQENTLLDSIFYGLRPASLALISAAGIQIVKISLLSVEAWNLSGKFLDLFNWKSIVLAAIIFILFHKFKGHPVYYLAGSAVIGILFKFST